MVLKKHLKIAENPIPENAPEWSKSFPWKIIKDVAAKYKFDPLLLVAIIQQESGGRQWVMRFEPSYSVYNQVNAFADANRESRPTEQKNQATSFGYCQVMGVTARGLGFHGCLGRLLDKHLNIELGGKLIRELLDRFGPAPEDIFAAYNAGRPLKTPGGLYVNQRYVDSVSRLYRELNKLS